MSAVKYEKVARYEKVEYDEHDGDGEGDARRAKRFGAMQENHRYDAIDANRAEQERGQVAEKVGEKDVELAKVEVNETNVAMKVEVHDDTDQSDVEEGQVDAV